MNWRLGLEVELLAPLGRSRRDLAELVARTQGGSLHRIFHTESEPSAVPGTPVFHNLTLGFEVRGETIVRCLDDLTLQKDLHRESPPKPGWYRVVSDDLRILRLIKHRANARASLQEVLRPIAELFGTSLVAGPGGMYKVDDDGGLSVAMVAPLPGERERPCELVTSPIDSDHFEYIDKLLGLAKSLNFTAPQEGATHLHFDASRLQNAHTFANLVALLWKFGAVLKRLLKTNPNCSRLGEWSEKLVAVVSHPGFRNLAWPEACQRLASADITKFCDFNIKNAILGRPELNTLEIRILPVHTVAGPIIEAAKLFVKLFEKAMETQILEPGEPLKASDEACAELLDTLRVSTDTRAEWLSSL